MNEYLYILCYLLKYNCIFLFSIDKKGRGRGRGRGKRMTEETSLQKTKPSKRTKNANGKMA